MENRRRRGFVPGINVVYWITDDGDRLAASQLHEALEPVELIGSPDPGSRCYVN